jgi:hypothetical protein
VLCFWICTISLTNVTINSDLVVGWDIRHQFHNHCLIIYDFFLQHMNHTLVFALKDNFRSSTAFTNAYFLYVFR